MCGVHFLQNPKKFLETKFSNIFWHPIKLFFLSKEHIYQAISDHFCSTTAAISQKNLETDEDVQMVN